MTRTVIHRNLSFEYDGETWFASKQGPRGSGDDIYIIWRYRDGAEVYGQTFDTLREVREYVDEARRNGWPLIDVQS